MTKTLALKLHQALRNPEQPEANGIKSGHYNTLEAADHWHQLFYSPLVSLLEVNVHCYKEHRSRKQQGERLASKYECRGSSLFSEAPSAGQWKKKHSLTPPITPQTSCYQRLIAITCGKYVNYCILCNYCLLCAKQSDVTHIYLPNPNRA